MTENQISTRLALSLQRALLGVVPHSLRLVTADWSGTEFRVRFVFDGPIEDDSFEDTQVVTTEVIADFHTSWGISTEIVRVDAPSDLRVLRLAEVSYQRKELQA